MRPEPAPAPETADAAAGVHSADLGRDGSDRYYDSPRPELARLVPPDARSVLDVGCGSGGLAAGLKRELGVEAVGIELFPDAAAVAAERLDKVIVADLERITELPFGDAHFDAMLFGDILEHVHDPHRLLRVLRRYLSPDGRIICSIPNVKHWSVLLPLLVHDRWEYTDQGLLDRTHVHFFTLEEIGRMLDDTGFEAVSVNALEVPPPEAVSVLAELAGSFGADRDETLARLGAYQYIIAARPTG